MRLFTRSLPASLLAVATLALAAPASAAVTLTFDRVGPAETYTTKFDGFIANPSSIVPGLTSEIVYSFLSATADGKHWTFSYAVDNTSSGPVTGSRVSIFGFDISSPLDKTPFSDAASATGIFRKIGDGNTPNAGPDLDICFRAGGGGTNCTGGGGGGVTIPGAVATGTFTLNFVSSASTVTFSNLNVRYQSVDIPGSGILGGSASGQAIQDLVLSVPEPSTWAMMIMGFGSIGAMIRGRRTLAA